MNSQVQPCFELLELSFNPAMLISLFLLKHKLQLVFPFIFQRATTVQDRWDVGNFWDEYIPYPICGLLAPLSLGKSGARRVSCALKLSVGLCVQGVSIQSQKTVSETRLNHGEKETICCKGKVYSSGNSPEGAHR